MSSSLFRVDVNSPYNHLFVDFSLVVIVVQIKSPRFRSIIWVTSSVSGR